jgi:hypothetical protein
LRRSVWIPAEMPSALSHQETAAQGGLPRMDTSGPPRLRCCYFGFTPTWLRPSRAAYTDAAGMSLRNASTPRAKSRLS